MTTWAVLALLAMAVPGWLLGRQGCTRRGEVDFAAVAGPLVAAFLVVPGPGAQQVVAGAAAGWVFGHLAGWTTALAQRQRARRPA
jgi:hypothetical protein